MHIAQVNELPVINLNDVACALALAQFFLAISKHFSFLNRSLFASRGTLGDALRQQRITPWRLTSAITTDSSNTTLGHEEYIMSWLRGVEASEATGYAIYEASYKDGKLTIAPDCLCPRCRSQQNLKEGLGCSP